MDDTTDTKGRDSATIRRDIERTRAEMDETVEALSQRLSPGALVDEAWNRMRRGEGPGLGDALRDHPMPLALMGLGLGWLAVEQARGGRDAPSRRRGGPGTDEPAEGRRGPYSGDAVDHDDPDWEHAGVGTRLKSRASDAGQAVSHAAGAVKEKASEAADAVKDAAGSARDRVSGAAHDAKEKVSDAAGSAREGARSAAEGARERVSDSAHHAAHEVKAGARRAREKTEQGFWTLLEESPLAVGAIAFGLGLASGVSAPTTRAEDRVMGRASDTVKDEARRVARETSEKAKRVAEDAVEAAADELEHQSETRDIAGEAREAREAAKESLDHAKEAAGHVVSEVKEAAKEVGRAAKDAAEESAREEELTGEGLAARTREAARDVKARTPAD